MFFKLFCFLLIINFSAAFNLEPGINIKIILTRNLSVENEKIFTQRFEAPSKSHSTIVIHRLDQKFLSHIVVQLHSYYSNVTFSTDKNITTKSNHQNGTNLGFILQQGRRERVLHLWNDNYEDVQCLAVVVVYNHSGPHEMIPALSLEETENFIVLKTPPSDNSNVDYFTFYKYLEQLNFDQEAYFDGIKSLLSYQNGYQAKQVYSPLKRYFEKIPGTGIIVNSVARDSKGQQTFYIPTVTYSCPRNTWNTHCSDIDMLKRAINVFLVLFAVVMMLNLLMPELIESLMNGMLIGAILSLVYVKNHKLLLPEFDVFMTMVFGGLFVSAVLGTITLYFKIGRYMTKLMFSNFVMAIIMEMVFEDVTSMLYQFGGALILSIVFVFIKFSFSSLFGGLLLITGLSHLLKVGNIHRILVNNFHALTSVCSINDTIWKITRPNFINYKIQLNLLDYALIIFYLIGAVLLTIRKEIYFRNNPDLLDADKLFSECEDIEEYNRKVAKKRRDGNIVGIQRTSTKNQMRFVSRYRRRHIYRSNVINERSPLISHWLESDESEDDVFESPNSNSRFMESLTDESKARLEAIQKFDRK